MLRITEHYDNDDTIRLSLDGTVTELSMREIEEVCARHRSTEKTILLDFSGVVFMSDPPAKKLAELRDHRFGIINCSPFIETLLSTVVGHDGSS